MSSSWRAFRVRKKARKKPKKPKIQKTRLRFNNEQMLVCHFKVISDLPARLYLQMWLLDLRFVVLSLTSAVWKVNVSDMQKQ